MKKQKSRDESRKSRVRKKPGHSLWYRQDPEDERMLILQDGLRIRQPIIGETLYVSCDKRAFTMNSNKVLREKRVNYWKKNHYGQLTRNGNHQGENYPYVNYHGHTYRMHQLVAMAWYGGIPKGFVADHVNGDIDDFSIENIRVIDIAENFRCGGILKRRRNLAKKRDDASLDPLNILQKDLLEIIERTKGVKGKKLDRVFLKEVERYRVLITLRHAAEQLHEPRMNPDNMEPRRREWMLSKYRVEKNWKLPLPSARRRK